MQTEIEAKFLDISHELIRSKLTESGGVCVRPMQLMKRKNFDYPDRRLEKKGGWVRVRDEGDKVTLSYKQLNDRSLHGTKEVNLEVNDFDTACLFLESIGLRAQSYQETRRESWLLGKVEIELDEWPWIPTFVEIEGPSPRDLEETAMKLGLLWNEAVHGSVEIAYQQVYDVSEEEVDHIAEITFDPVPEWLEERRRDESY
jgi:adenylate cyclase, class 2